MTKNQRPAHQDELERYYRKRARDRQAHIKDIYTWSVFEGVPPDNYATTVPDNFHNLPGDNFPPHFSKHLAPDHWTHHHDRHPDANHWTNQDSERARKFHAFRDGEKVRKTQYHASQKKDC